MRIQVDTSPVGVGKTQRAIELMVGIPTRYVYACEKVEMMQEIASRILAASTSATSLPVIVMIHRGNHSIANVGRQIADLPGESAAHDHVIALITHEGMMASEFVGFEGWTLIVDEVPSMIAMHPYRTPTDLAFFETNYVLTPASDDPDERWSLVTLTDAGKALDLGALSKCEGHSYLHQFHRRCRDPRMGPVVNLRSWEEMTEKRREWVWWSLFQPSQIASFSNILFLGNGFTKSVSFSLFDNGEIEWNEVYNLGNRPLRHRNARVVYYSDRPTSLSYLASEAGQDDLGKIAAHVAASTVEPMFWSANDRTKAAVERHLDPSAYRTPRQAGTSALMAYHCAAIFYAAKPSREIEQAIRGLGSNADQWVATNEYETILQFLTRTSVRDVSSTADVTLHVFNRDQARYLKAFFDAQPHITCTLEKVDLDLSTQVRKAPGRKALVLTPEEREAHAAEKREKHRLRMRERRAKVSA